MYTYNIFFCNIANRQVAEYLPSNYKISRNILSNKLELTVWTSLMPTLNSYRAIFLTFDYKLFSVYLET